MARALRRYQHIGADLVGDMIQLEWCKGDINSLKRRVKQLKKMLAEKFDEQCRFGLYTLKYYLLDDMVDDVLNIGT